MDVTSLFQLLLHIIVLGQQSAFGSPVTSAGFGRTIRHLPCVSRRTGETGVCMFAFSCAKANGTHLGTCIDRFYFGSCCKIIGQDMDLVAPLDSNHISEDVLVSSSTSTESLLLSTYQSVQEVKNSTQTPQVTVQSTTPRSKPPLTIMTNPVTTEATKKPVTTVTKPYVEVTTTRRPIVQTTVSSSVPSKPAYHKPPSTTKPNLIHNKPAFNQSSPATKPTGRPPPKPTPSSVTKPTQTMTKPTQKPVNQTATKPHRPVTQKPVQTRPSTVGSKPPTVSTLPSTVASRPSLTPTPKPPTRPPSKPATKPELKPTTSRPSSPTYVQVPVTTLTPVSKPSAPSSTTISNDIIPPTGTFSTITSVESEEEDSNVINGSPSPTTIPPALVTWTTVDEKPVPPFPKPVSTPVSPSINTTSETKVPVTTTTITPLTTTSATWVQVSVTTHAPVSSVSEPKPESSSTTVVSHRPATATTKPTTISTRRPTTPSTITKTTTTTTIAPSTVTKTTTTEPSTTKKTTTPSTTTTKPTTTTTTTTPSTTTMKTTTQRPSSTTPKEPPPASTTSTPTASTVGLSKPTYSTDKTPTTTPVSTVNGTSTNGSTSDTDLGIINNEIIDTSHINMSDFTDVCGRRLFPQSRIVGGDKATFGKWPWQISLRQWRTSTYLHKCGAALLNENWAITAAHCVENVPPSDLLLRLGEHDLSLEDEPYGYQERRVQIVASHPQFDARTFEYDLALLRFYEPVTFQPNIIPICVPQDDTNFVGSTAYVTGWGRLYEDGPLPSVLQEVSVPVINNSVCETMYRAAGYIEHIPEIFICAGWRKGGFDSCEGDSGGPMVIQRPDKRWLLAGVISWGIGCAEPNQPGVYTRISEFREWINQILQF